MWDERGRKMRRRSREYQRRGCLTLSRLEETAMTHRFYPSYKSTWICCKWFFFNAIFEWFLHLFSNNEGEVGRKGQILKDFLKWLNQSQLKHKRALVESEVEMCYRYYDSALRRYSHCCKVLFSFSHDTWGCICSGMNCDQEFKMTPEASFHISGGFEILQRITSCTDWCQIGQRHCSVKVEAAQPNRPLMPTLI